MRRIPYRHVILIVVLSIVLTTAQRLRSADAPPPANVHDRLVAQYMQGKWEELEKELIASLKEISALPAAPRADVEYIRRAVAECRPAWWKSCKAGERVRFKPLVWRSTLSATYDPAAATSPQVNYVNGAASFTLFWKSAEMDNPAIEGELEFTKGENAELAVWNILGTVEPWTALSPHFLVKMNDEAKLQFNRFLGFRGNVTAMYYCSPRARRLAIWNAISGYSGEYAKSPDVMTRKAPAVMYVVETLSHPETYPSIKRPQEPPAEEAESKIVWEMQEWIRHNNLTFAEDKALREAIKTFATANASEQKFRQTGKVVLSNGLALALDPAADKPLSVQRDAWIKARYGKGK